MQSIFAAILPSPIVEVGTLITRYLVVKGRGRLIHLSKGVFPVEIHWLKNIKPVELDDLARQI